MHKTIYSRLICSSQSGVFDGIFADLAARNGKAGRTDATRPEGASDSGQLAPEGNYPDLSGAAKGA